MSLPHPATATQARLPRGVGLRPALPFTLFILFALFIPLLCSAARSADLPPKDQPHVRWPVAVATLDSDNLAVANRCGTISIVDTQAKVVISEIPVGDRLADIEAYPNQKLWLAVDEYRSELIELVRHGNTLRVTKRHPVSGNPVSLAVSPTGLVAVASLWSRNVTLFGPVSDEEAGASTLEEKSRLTLNFNPGDVFFDANKILRRIDEPPQPLTRGEIEYQEKYSHFLVRDAFGGATARIEPRPPFNVEKGIRKPVDWWPRGYKSLFDQSLPQYKDGIESYESFGLTIPLGPTSPLTPAQRGELLFAGDTFGSRNCHDCHNRGHTTYELSDTLADGTTGTPKRIPTLLGTRLSDPWAWNGKFRNLDEQVRSSLETTMHVKDFTTQQISDLTAFLHTLPPPPPLQPATDDPADKAQLTRGRDLFTSLGCAKCHIPPLTYTSPDTYDVGLADKAGLTKFNPPSLRGVSQGYSYFHDGRAKSLDEVFTIHGHQLDRALTDPELSDLLRFLRSL